MLRGQAHREARAAGVARVKLDGAAVALGHGPHDREPEPAASAGALAVAAHETVEDALA